MANPVVIDDALFTAGLVLSAQDARAGLAALVAHDGSGPRLGVFYEGNQALITGTATTSPSMQISVSPLAFAGQKALTEGVYIGRSTGTVLVDIAAAPASNSRIDTVYVMERDQNSTTSPDSVTQGEIGVITGTAAVSPTAPAAPAGAVVLGTVQVAAGVTATTNAGCTITTTCTWTTGAGAPIPVRNPTERGALSAFDGLLSYDLGLGIVSVSDYTGYWRSTGPFAMATGSVAVTTTSGTPNVAQTITLPSGLFTLAPNIQVSWASNSGSEPMLRLYTITTSNFGLNVISAPSDIGPVSGTVYWVAIQATTSAA